MGDSTENDTANSAMRLDNLRNNQKLILSEDRYTVGRGKNCSYVIESLQVSRIHFVLERRNGDKWFITDLSANGTIVNKHKIPPRVSVPLNVNDIIRLNDDYNFMFCQHRAEPSNEDINEIFRLYEEAQNNFQSTAATNNTETKRKVNNAVANSSIIDLSSPDKTSEIPSRSKDEANKKNDGKIEKPIENKAVQEPVAGPSKSSDNEHLSEELTCSICSELFIEAVTLNCQHSFCSYCIATWKKTKRVCPICRGKITGTVRTLVLDNIIRRLIDDMPLQERQVRDAMIAERNSEKTEPRRATKRRITTTNRRSNRIRLDEPATIEISSEEDDDDFFLDDDDDDDNIWLYPETDTDSEDPAYGGYGACYICHTPGHWAPSCPLRRRR